MDDGAVEARRQLLGDPLPTTGCTSCKRSTVGVIPESVREWAKIETHPHRVHDVDLNAQLVEIPSQDGW